MYLGETNLIICFTGPTDRNLDGFQIIIIFFSVPGHKQKQEDHELEIQNNFPFLHF